MTAAAEDEWTFVSNSKSRRRRRNPSEPRRHKSTGNGGNGFRASPNNEAGGTRDTPGERYDTAAATYDKGQIQSDILRCLDSFEEQIRCGNGFAHRLVSALATASRRSRTPRTPNGGGRQSAESSSSLREVVAYGIGNFATGRFQSPMLQLACALLLRRMAASALVSTESTTNKQKQMLDCNGRHAADTSSAFRSEQDVVQLYYFDPCMLPVEKEMLETTFHVHVLDSNDMGKLSIEVMRSQIKLGETHSSIETQSGCFPTLFYMPHCPMRLYSNVLWSHWEHLFPSCKCSTKSSGVASATEIDAEGDIHPILIFGNSFSAYEDRTISSEDLSDPTNGVFKVVPHSHETRVAVREKDEIIPETLRHIEMAFSDSNVTSFCPGGQQSDENRLGRPSRPKEWLRNDDPELNGR